MSKMKKVLLMCTAYVLVAALAIGGTIAYLQDSDSDVNVMTLGNVSIEQHEYQRADGVAYDAGEPGAGNGVKEGALVEFVQDQKLYPAVPKNGAATDYTAEMDTAKLFFWGDYVYSGTAGNGLWNDDKLSNVMDKMVFVENNGKTDAYVRTLIAFECPEGITIGEPSQGAEIMINTNIGTYDWEDVGYITVDDVRYAVMTATYKNVLNPGNQSHPSLLQVVMTHNATNEDMELLGDTYEILVLSQAVQAAGFDNAATALDTSFGDDNTTNAAKWFDGVIVPSVKTLSELREAMATGGEFVLANDIVVEASDLLYAADGGHSDGSAFFVKNDTVIDLNGHDIKVTSGNAWSDVFFMKFGADLTIKGEGDIEADCSIACVYDANSTLNVEGGNFYVTANNDMLYAIYGKINVSGGTFTTSYWNTINIYGSGRVDRVDVSGGSFENWNPASSPDGNLLADGYKVVSEVVDGVTWYTVVAE